MESSKVEKEPERVMVVDEVNGGATSNNKLLIETAIFYEQEKKKKKGGNWICSKRITTWFLPALPHFPV